MKLSQNIDHYKTIGLGNPKDIAIVLTSHGIGDDISAMPAIAQKIKDGFTVTVFCKPFQRKIFESLGCKVYPSIIDKDMSERNISFGAFIGDNFNGEREIFELKDRFGIIYECPQWSVWEIGSRRAFYDNRIHLFAELIETTISNSFSWIEVLNPRIIQKDFILFAPNSASRMRDLRGQKKLYKRLKKHFNVVVFGTDILYHYKQFPYRAQIGKAEYLKPFFSNIKCAVLNFALTAWNYSIDRKKILCSFEDFISYIYSAKVVVSADNGVMNTARAFGIPTVGIFGCTPEIAASQYSEFNDAAYTVIKCSGSHYVETEDKFEYIIEQVLQLKENKQWDKYIREPIQQTTPALGLTT